MSEKFLSGANKNYGSPSFFYCVWQSPYLLKTERQALRLTTFQYLRGNKIFLFVFWGSCQL